MRQSSFAALAFLCSSACSSPSEIAPESCPAIAKQELPRGTLRSKPHTEESRDAGIGPTAAAIREAKKTFTINSDESELQIEYLFDDGSKVVERHRIVR